MEKGRMESRLEDIRKVMKSLGFTMEKAMDTLEIPQSHRNVYADLVKQG